MHLVPSSVLATHVLLLAADHFAPSGDLYNLSQPRYPNACGWRATLHTLEGVGCGSLKQQANAAGPLASQTFLAGARTGWDPTKEKNNSQVLYN